MENRYGRRKKSSGATVKYNSASTGRATLAHTLETIFARYHDPRYLVIDPLCWVRRFKGRDTRTVELAGLLAAIFAYGRVELIIRHLEAVELKTGTDLVGFVSDTGFEEKRALFKGFAYRFNDGVDLALFFEVAGRMQERFGSIGRFFADRGREGHATARAIDCFSKAVLDEAASVFGKRKKTFEFLFPRPAHGSACKRMNMFLRWMVRPDDGIDMGVWEYIRPDGLIMPVDTHVARAARRLGLTGRSVADWRMADEITDFLRLIDPQDPVRFDFSLCRFGMLESSGPPGIVPAARINIRRERKRHGASAEKEK